jgi:hypothetical protein
VVCIGWWSMVAFFILPYFSLLSSGFALTYPKFKGVLSFYFYISFSSYFLLLFFFVRLFFKIDFFSSFILQHYVCLQLSFIVFFLVEWSWPHNPNHRFERLTRVDIGLLFRSFSYTNFPFQSHHSILGLSFNIIFFFELFFKINFFSSFILQH